jgi:hypothetical protein
VSQESDLEASVNDLQHLNRNTSNLGGVIVLLAGVFKKNIRAIPLGTETRRFQTCMKSSYVGYEVKFIKDARGQKSRVHNCLKYLNQLVL